MNRKPLRLILVVLFFLFVLSPLILMPLNPYFAEQALARKLSVALGFVGLTLAGWQLAPISRFTPAQKLFDMDKLYRLHHFLSLTSALFVLVHWLLIVFDFREGFSINAFALRALYLFGSRTGPLLGAISLWGYVLISLTSAFRKPLKLGYDAWRVLHDIFTVLLVGGGLWHALVIANYSAAPAMKTLLWAQTALWILAALYIRVIKPLLQLRRPYTIVEVRPEADTVFSLALAPKGFKLPAFHPGQVAWLTVRSSPFSMRRWPFSISSSAENHKRVEFAIKELGDFTKTVKNLKRGETVYVDGPFGSYDITHPSVKGIVLLAGGIGIAPAISIIRTLRDRQDKRPLYLFFGSHVVEHLTFDREIRANPTVKYVPVVETPTPDWKGDTGFITTAILKRELPQNYRELDYFVCGPLPMITAMERSFKELGIPKERIHTEKFEMA